MGGKYKNRGDEWVRVVGRIIDDLPYAPLQFCVRIKGCSLGGSSLDAMAR